jgi:hypothetical protein
MNAVFGGVNLADILVRISAGDTAAAAEPGAPGVRTHMLLMGLLTRAAAGRRRDVAAELLRAMRGRGVYAGSREELLPLRIDYKSLFPLGYVLSRLLADPKSATALSNGSIASYALSPEAARQIANAGPASRA